MKTSIANVWSLEQAIELARWDLRYLMHRSDKLAKISAREKEVLDELQAFASEDIHSCRRCMTMHRAPWLAPMMYGGRDASHHSRALKRLVRAGLAEEYHLTSHAMMRGSYLYRLAGVGAVCPRDTSNSETT